MNEAKPQWEPTGLERFSHLEDKIHRVVEAFKTIRKENEGIKADNQKLKEEIQALSNTSATQQEALVSLQKEREALRERVEKALGLLGTLEVK
jgi:FtsZ-binding cell division protein ZapB